MYAVTKCSPERESRAMSSVMQPGERIAQTAQRVLTSNTSRWRRVEVAKRMMRKTAWIWFVGAAVWFADAVVQLRLHAQAHAKLALMLALVFFAAGDDRARVSHASSRRRRLPRDKTHHRLLHICLDELCRPLLRRSADLAD